MKIHPGSSIVVKDTANTAAALLYLLSVILLLENIDSHNMTEQAQYEACCTNYYTVQQTG